MNLLRRDPFRVLFPLGAVLAWAGVGVWLLFVGGRWGGWPGVAHALTMTQAFLGTVALGFLGTMLPRRSGTEPLSGAALALFAAALVAVAVLLFAGATAAAEATWLVVLLGLARFVLSRLVAMRSRTEGRPAPPSFVFLPVGLLLAMGGALLLILASGGGHGRAFLAGRSLAEEGLLEALVLAIAPVLVPVIAHGQAMADAAPGWRARLPWLGAAALFVASFALQHLVDDRLGLGLRGAVLAAALSLGAHAWRPPTREGLHRALFWLALLVVPLGLLLAAAIPPLRLGLLHLSFVGGLSLLVFAVTFHVVFLHTGREALAAGHPAPVLGVAVLTLAAAVVRAGAEQAGPRYFLALGTASSLWLAASVVWGLYLLALLVRRPPAPALGAASMGGESTSSSLRSSSPRSSGGS